MNEWNNFQHLVTLRISNITWYKVYDTFTFFLGCFSFFLLSCQFHFQVCYVFFISQLFFVLCIDLSSKFISSSVSFNFRFHCSSAIFLLFSSCCSVSTIRRLARVALSSFSYACRLHSSNYSVNVTTSCFFCSSSNSRSIRLAVSSSLDLSSTSRRFTSHCRLSTCVQRVSIDFPDQWIEFIFGKQKHFNLEYIITSTESVLY